MLPVGFDPSSFTKISAQPLPDNRSSLIRGVFPIAFISELYYFT
jgi:hypothetical protein